MSGTPKYKLELGERKRQGQQQLRWWVKRTLAEQAEKQFKRKVLGQSYETKRDCLCSLIYVIGRVLHRSSSCRSLQQVWIIKPSLTKKLIMAICGTGYTSLRHEQGLVVIIWQTDIFSRELLLGCICSVFCPFFYENTNCS